MAHSAGAHECKDEITDVLTVLMNGPVRERLKDKIFNTELAKKEAYLAELRKLVAETPDPIGLALAYGWLPD